MSKFDILAFAGIFNALWIFSISFRCMTKYVVKCVWSRLPIKIFPVGVEVGLVGHGGGHGGRAGVEETGCVSSAYGAGAV